MPFGVLPPKRSRPIIRSGKKMALCPATCGKGWRRRLLVHGCARNVRRSWSQRFPLQRHHQRRVGPRGGLRSGVCRTHRYGRPYISQFGTEEQKRRWLPGLVSGQTIAAIAMSEPNTGSDVAAVQTTAVRHAHHYLLNGQKPSSPTASSTIWSSWPPKPTPGRRQRRQPHRRRTKHGRV